MRILACGSLGWTDWPTVRQGLADVAAEAESRGEPITLIHGGARGADAMADAFARRRWWEVEVYPADWTRFGKAAGPIRNQEMVNSDPHVVVAFWKARSRGTANTIDRARASGIPVVIYEED